MTLFTQTALGVDYIDFLARTGLKYLRSQGRSINKVEFNKLRADVSVLENDPDVIRWKIEKQQAYEELDDAAKAEVQYSQYKPRLIVMAVYKRMKELEKADQS